MIIFNSGNIPADHIDNTVAANFVRLRALYNYPAACIEQVSKAAADIRIAKGVYGRFVVPPAGAITGLRLDDYHFKLLRSKSGTIQLLGLASVVYWGFFTFGDRFARRRVLRLLNGYRKKPGVSVKLASTRLRAATRSTAVGATGAALGQCAGLSQLGQTPFASKVIAFLSPSLAGVFDNRICKGVRDQPWALPFWRGIGQVHNVRIQEAYQAWCLFLSLIASNLNAGISAGRKDWRWSCGEDTNQMWRAIDVERAIFAAYARD